MQNTILVKQKIRKGNQLTSNRTFCDLYLYIIPENNNLIKIPHLTMEDAHKYAAKWFESNELHDYMLVIEGSTPWYEPIPNITIKNPSWIEKEILKLNGA